MNYVIVYKYFPVLCRTPCYSLTTSNPKGLQLRLFVNLFREVSPGITDL